MFGVKMGFKNLLPYGKRWNMGIIFGLSSSKVFLFLRTAVYVRGHNHFLKKKKPNINLDH
jgi:hypothetical protein